MANPVYFYASGSPPPPTPPSIVSLPLRATGPLPVLPNKFTYCLLREFRLFEELDYTALTCGGKPECFCKPENDWGHADYPAYAVSFNPTLAIPLPAVGDGEVDVIVEPNPIGYDGVILAQFNQYIPALGGGPGLTEGSGDIIWRVRADGRFLKDCGNITTTLGTQNVLSPIDGGLQTRSGNRIRYTVQVYNAGLMGGYILCGLHGYFYPRNR